MAKPGKSIRAPVNDDDPPRPSRGDELRRAADAIPHPELAAKLREAAKASDELDAVLLAAIGRLRPRG